MPNNNSKNYNRKRGHRAAVGQIQVSICFSWAKLDNTRGEAIDEWE